MHNTRLAPPKSPLTSAYTFGCNVSGALGRGTLGMQDPVPRQVPLPGPLPVPQSTASVTQAAAGWGHTALVTSDGGLYLLGRATDGDNALRFGRFAKTNPRLAALWTRWGGQHSIDFPAPTLVIPSDAVAVSCSFGSTIFLNKSLELYALGQNRFGQTGSGKENPDVLSWSQVKISSAISRFSCGYQHAAAVDVAGRLFTWGKGSRGQLGTSVVDSPHLPYQLPQQVTRLSGKVSDVKCGFGHTVALLENGDVFAWGKLQGAHGADARLPGKLDMPAPAIRIWCGQFHSLAQDAKGRMWQFGARPDAPLVTQRPERVLGFPEHQSLREVAAGFGQSMAVFEDGKVFEWDWGLSAKPCELPGIQDLHVRSAALGWRHGVLLVDDCD
jgi:alpha-tubulin suppressor-like RCC1 family protein